MVRILLPFFKEGSYDVLKKNCNTFSHLTRTLSGQLHHSSTGLFCIDGESPIRQSWFRHVGFDIAEVRFALTVWPTLGRGDCALFCLLGERLPIKYRTIEKVAWQHRPSWPDCKSLMPRSCAKHIAQTRLREYWMTSPGSCRP